MDGGKETGHQCFCSARSKSFGGRIPLMPQESNACVRMSARIFEMQKLLRNARGGGGHGFRILVGVDHKKFARDFLSAKHGEIGIKIDCFPYTLNLTFRKQFHIRAFISLVRGHHAVAVCHNRPQERKIDAKQGQ